MKGAREAVESLTEEGRKIQKEEKEAKIFSDKPTLDLTPEETELRYGLRVKIARRPKP
jgi:hypothetical protein